MQINVHYAVGVIIAGLARMFLSISDLMYAIIILGSMFPDLDIIFSKFAPENNHRNLITHTIYLPILAIIIGLVIGLISGIWGFLIAGVAYFLHLVFDMLDWGVNLFLSGKTYGPRFLINPAEKGKKFDILDKTKITPLFFTKRYYSAPFIWIIEIGSIIGMIIFLFVVEYQHWYFIFGYFATVGFHLIKYLIAKRKSDA